ncbi:hypothetical protein tloyanaT_21750 [Thalassotalea loyana]|uniref:Uncharacterized protein n=1 Tax=Thalassotalea loyana TaxID=280483 RepID=A0ABQ6HCU1_9GAMM|nr:hypothetical protein [Thalassotalea loyana]GLX85923.1 hypothetical protein tloyanaT_21750 [Thalassotalea loyana]
MSTENKDSPFSFIFAIMWLTLFIFPLNSQWSYFLVSIIIFLSVIKLIMPFKKLDSHVNNFWWWFITAIIVNSAVGVYLSTIEKGEFTIAIAFIVLYAISFPFLKKSIKFLNNK